MGFLALLVIGAAAGYLAARVLRIDADPVTIVVVGGLGALIGALLLRGVLAVMGWVAGFLGAILGAVALIVLWQRYGGGRR